MLGKNAILKGAFILGVGAFIAKLLGAIYRVPLTNLIGGYGLGLYQMVFPVYSLLLDFAGAGAPNAIAKLTSSTDQINNKKILKVSKILLSSLGVLSFFIMLVFSGLISRAQGNIDAKFAYITLSPAIIAVALISCYRGYFQGQSNMTPTAISQVIEQLVKIGLGIILVYLYRENVVKSVSMATLAITVSEFVALLFLVWLFRSKNDKSLFFKIEKNEFKNISIKIIQYTLPVALTGIIIPFSQVADSFIIINGLKRYSSKATTLYGLLSGVALTVINLPVSLCYGVATSSIPEISKENNNLEKIKNVKKSLYITFALSFMFALLSAFFSRIIVNILFRNLSGTEKDLCVKLIKLLSITITLLSVLQTTNAVLIAVEMIYRPVISMTIGVFFKLIIEFLLLKIESVNIYAGAIGLITCYFIAVLINLITVRVKVIKNASKTNSNR